MYKSHFNIALAKAPTPFGRANLHVIATQAAMRDAGVAWLYVTISRAVARKS
jgi:hypothetical protein